MDDQRGQPQDIDPQYVHAQSPLVLIVDDELAFASTLAEVLRTRGYRTAIATTGRTAASVLAQEQVDLALVDLKLPDVDGIELIARMRRASPATTAIVVTGHASIDNAVRALKRGAFGYIEKPYDIERLFVLMECALGQARADASTAVGADRLLSASNIPTFLFDPRSGRIQTANAAASDLADHRRDGKGLRTLGQLLADRAEVDLHLTELENDGYAESETAIPTAGQVRWYKVHSTLDRSTGSALAFVLDITDSRTREHKTSKERQYFEAIFNNIGAGVAIIDSNYTVRLANPAFAKFFDLSPSLIKGRRCHSVIHRHPTPCHFHGEVCPLKTCLVTGSIARVRHSHPDGRDQVHHIESTFAPLRDANGTIVSMVAIFMDLTDITKARTESEQKTSQLEKLNQELQQQKRHISTQADRLRAANRELIRLSSAKDDFVSMVSHELRTPLTAITEGISLIGDGTLGPLAPKQKEFLDLVHRNSVRLGNLISDILDLSKIEADRMDISPTGINVAGLIEEVCDTFKATAIEKNLAVTVDVADESLEVYADNRLVHRVLNNLTNNALKFTDKGSVTLRAAECDDEVIFSVTDTGIGVPETEHEMIFERFHQVGRPDGQRPPGTGLGMALTKEMVEMSGGRIWLESEEDRGTTVNFTLPPNRETSHLNDTLNRYARSDNGHGKWKLLLARVDNGNEICELHGPGAVRAVLGSAREIVTERLASASSCEVLPGTDELLAILAGDPGTVARQHRETQDLLVGSTFLVGNRAADVRMRFSIKELNGSHDAAATLAALREGLTDAV